MIDNEEVEDKPLPKEVLEVLYAGQELDEDSCYYIDQADDKVFISLLRIELLSQHCGQNFPSRSTFHKHFKNECVPVQDLVNTTSPTPLSSPILDLQSKATFEAGGSDFAFRGWSYATTTITLVLSGVPDYASPAELCCLNSGFRVMLVNCS